MAMSVKILDCTLRDGGYYNSWDFREELIEEYLQAMSAISIDYVEMGFRGFPREGFLGGCAYTSDDFILSLSVPESLSLGVMVNASEIVNHPEGLPKALSTLFKPASESPISLVRIPCHFYELEAVIEGVSWLKAQGYQVGLNIMQIAGLSVLEIKQLAKIANECTPDILYFADSMGGMDPKQTIDIINVLRLGGWSGELGVHTHDNMNRALINSLEAIENGVTWVDGTVTGMGRGAGNSKTEYLILELASLRNDCPINMTPLMRMIRRHFAPMQQVYGWGPNAYYYLAGKYSIHPTYIQSMLSDTRYEEEDVLTVIEYLKSSGGKRFNPNTLDAARHFYVGEPIGTWAPETLLSGQTVLILGAGPGIIKYRFALENFVRRRRVVVIALNTQTHLEPDLIDIRAACHPMRLLADCDKHRELPQPLITPASMLPDDIHTQLSGKKLLDFGLSVQPGKYYLDKRHCILPTSMVFAYVLAIAVSGKAKEILLAGFDGYEADDPRNDEINCLLNDFSQIPQSPPIRAITPTRYGKVIPGSVYAY